MLLLRIGGCAKTVLSVLAGRVASSSSWWISVTITPLRFAASDSRSSSRESVEEMDGNVAWVFATLDVLMLVDGGRDLGRGCMCGNTDARGDEGGVENGECERRGVSGATWSGGGGRGYEAIERSRGEHLLCCTRHKKKKKREFQGKRILREAAAKTFFPISGELLITEVCGSEELNPIGLAEIAGHKRVGR